MLIMIFFFEEMKIWESQCWTFSWEVSQRPLNNLETYNVLSWRRPTRIIEYNSWLHTRVTKS